MPKKNKPTKIKHPGYYPKWQIYMVTVLIVIIILSFLFKNRFLTAGTFFIQPTITPFITLVPSLNIIPPGKFGLSQQEYVSKAISDLSLRLNIDTNQIRLISVEPKKWNDSSIGCPQKGTFYSQVITSGYIITLSAEGNNWIYNAGSNKVIICK